MLNIQNYKKVESIEEAYELNQKKANRIVGGMMWMRMGDNRINTAIDMSGLGLDKIEETEEEFKIGCMTSLRQLENHKGFNEYTNGCAKEALRHIVGVQFRNLATVGGSIYGRYGFSDVLTLLIGQMIQHTLALAMHDDAHVVDPGVDHVGEHKVHTAHARASFSITSRKV